MANPYNPYNPMGYPNGYPYQQSPTPTNAGINWVQGEAGANSWYVAPGQVAVLFDSTSNVFYIKSCDQMGKPQPLETYDYSKHTEQMQTQPDMSQFVTKDEMKKYIEELFGNGEKK